MTFLELVKRDLESGRILRQPRWSVGPYQAAVGDNTFALFDADGRHFVSGSLHAVASAACRLTYREREQPVWHGRAAGPKFEAFAEAGRMVVSMDMESVELVARGVGA